jgi:hypothetical protein
VISRAEGYFNPASEILESGNGNENGAGDGERARSLSEIGAGE